MEAQKETLSVRQMWLNDCDREAGNPPRFVQVVTNYWAKPIPPRNFDWSAQREGDEPNDDGQMLCGYGATEQDAINDLLEQIECGF